MKTHTFHTLRDSTKMCSKQLLLGIAARTEISQVDLTILIIDPALVLKMLALVGHAHSSQFYYFFEVWFEESGKILLSDECRNTTCMLRLCLSVNVK